MLKRELLTISLLLCSFQRLLTKDDVYDQWPSEDRQPENYIIIYVDPQNPDQNGGIQVLVDLSVKHIVVHGSERDPKPYLFHISVKGETTDGDLAKVIKEAYLNDNLKDFCVDNPFTELKISYTLYSESKENDKTTLTTDEMFMPKNSHNHFLLNSKDVSCYDETIDFVGLIVGDWVDVKDNRVVKQDFAWENKDIKFNNVKTLKTLYIKNLDMNFAPYTRLFIFEWEKDIKNPDKYDWSDIQNWQTNKGKTMEAFDLYDGLESGIPIRLGYRNNAISIDLPNFYLEST